MHARCARYLSLSSFSELFPLFHGFQPYSAQKDGHTDVVFSVAPSSDSSEIANSRFDESIRDCGVSAAAASGQPPRASAALERHSRKLLSLVVFVPVDYAIA